MDITPATTVETPWLADGFIAFLGLSQDGGTDKEVFLFTGTPPADASQPSPPLFVVATPGDGQVTVAWDQIIRASSYNLYMASVPGVTKDNYSTLPDGMKHTGVTSPFVHTGLTPGKTYYFVVTTVEDGVEGPDSREAAATVIGTLTWVSVGGLSTISFHAVAADKTDGSIAYAAGGKNVYKTTDGGNTWTALAGGIEGLDVRALAVNGPTVFAASRDIFGGEPSKILRSTDGGTSWEEVVPNGGEIGETRSSTRRKSFRRRRRPPGGKNVNSTSTSRCAQARQAAGSCRSRAARTARIAAARCPSAPSSSRRNWKTGVRSRSQSATCQSPRPSTPARSAAKKSGWTIPGAPGTRSRAPWPPPWRRRSCRAEPPRTPPGRPEPTA